MPDAIHQPLATDVAFDKPGALTRDHAEQLPRNRRIVVGNLGVIVRL